MAGKAPGGRSAGVAYVDLAVGSTKALVEGVNASAKEAAEKVAANFGRRDVTERMTAPLTAGAKKAAQSAGKALGAELGAVAGRESESAGERAGQSMGNALTQRATKQIKEARASFVAAGESAGTAVGEGFGAKAHEQVVKFGERAKETLHESLTTAVGFGLASTVGAGFFQLGDFLKESTERAEESEKQLKATEAAIESTGSAAGVSAEHVDSLARSLAGADGKTVDAIRDTENLLLRFTNIHSEIYDRAVPAVQDLAVAMHVDATTAARILGKALDSPTQGMVALQRVGVRLTDDQKAQVQAFVAAGQAAQAQGVILDVLAKKMGGTAEAVATPAEKARAAWDSVKVEVGELLLPALDSLGRFVSSKLVPAFSTGVDAIKAGFSGSSERLTGFAEVLRQLGEAARTFGQIFGKVASSVKDSAGAMLSALSPVLRGFASLSDAVGPLTLVATVVELVFARRIGAAMNDVNGRFSAFRQNITEARSYMAEASLSGLSLAEAQRDVNASFGTAAGTIGGISGRMQAASIQGNTFKGVLQSIQLAGSGAKAGLSSLTTFLGGPWGIALMAATLAVGYFTQRSAEQKAKLQELKTAVAELGDAYRENHDLTDQSIESIVKQNDVLSDLVRNNGEYGASVQDIARAAAGEKDAQDAVIDALQRHAQATEDLYLAQLKSNKDDPKLGKQVDAEYDRINALKKSFAQINQNTEVTRKLSEAEKEQESTSVKLSKADQELYDAMEAVRNGTADAETAAKALKSAWDKLFGAAKNQDQANEDYKASVDNLTKSTREHGKALSYDTEAGRANADALKDVAQKSVDLYEADIAAGVPQDQATKRHNDRIAALKKEAAAAGLSKQETDRLIQTYGQIPDAVTTQLVVLGYADAYGKLNSIGQIAAQLANTFGIDAQTAANLAPLSQNKPHDIHGRRYATGGPVVGDGSKTSDSNLAWLSHGEFVQQAAAVDYYGVDFMDAINQRLLPKFSAGGLNLTWSSDLAKWPSYNRFAGAMSGLLAHEKATLSQGAGLPASVARWTSTVLQVLAALGQPASLLGAVLRRINLESGGNPNAINLTDSNAIAGHPSQGLVQTIPGTFAAYAGPYASRGITDPFANIYAGMNYAINRYGSIAAIDPLVMPSGYDNGGIMKPGVGMYANLTKKPEAVLTNDQWATAKAAINAAERQTTVSLAGARVVVQVGEHEFEGYVKSVADSSADARAAALTQRLLGR